MKRLPILTFAFLLVSAVIGMTACGPSAEEKARMDSIRIADSLRRIDSIKIVDSLKAVAEMQNAAQALREKVDKEAANIKAQYKIKMYELGKIVYTNEVNDMFAKDWVKIFNVETGETKTITLPHSDEWGSIEEFVEKGDNKTVVAKLNNIGNAPIVHCYDIDVENEKVKKEYDE